MTATQFAASEFRIGRVLSLGFSILFRNIVPFGLIALLAMSPPYVYAILVGPSTPVMSENPMEYWSQMGAGRTVVFVAKFLLIYLIIAALTYGTIRELRNDRASLGECFSKGLALMFPALSAAIVMSLAIMLVALITILPGALLVGVVSRATGSIALTVLFAVAIMIPSLHVLIILWVTIPVAVIERRGVGSLGRSAALTKGYRWRIFFLLLILGVIETAVWRLMAVVGGTMSPMGMLDGGSADTAVFTGQIAIQWVLSAFFGALSAVLFAVTYHDLRVAKEGADTDEIASVFD